MDEHLTDEQQLERIRQWFKDNGLSLILGVVIGLSSLGGWKFYQSHKIESANSASDAYQAMVKLSEQADKRADFLASAEALVKDHAGTVYAQFGQLYLAREAVKDNDLEKAASLLSAVRSAPEHEAIGHIASLRLARVLVAQQKTDDALKLTQIDKVKAGSYYSAYLKLRGDVLMNQGKLADAHAAYDEAKQLGDVMANHPELNLKLDVTTL